MNDVDLFQLVRMGDRDTLLHVRAERDIQVVNEFGQNLLHEAIAFKQRDIARDLLRLGIDVNCRDDQGATPLHFAAAHGDSVITRSIIQNGGNVNLRDEHGNTPLWTAVFNAKGNYAIVNELIRANASSNSQNRHGRSPLDFARQIKDRDMVAILETAV